MADTNALEEIILADGTVLKDSHCGYSNHDLWCFVKDKTMAECLLLFSDTLKTRSIISHILQHSYKYTGFTELLLIEKSDEKINVRLTWPEGGEHSVEELEESEDA